MNVRTGRRAAGMVAFATALSVGLTLSSTAAPAAAGLREVELASVNSQEEVGEHGSQEASLLSEDGRYVVFSSSSRNLDPRKPVFPTMDEVYLRDRGVGTTELLTLGPDGLPTGGFAADLTPDARHVLVYSFGRLTAEDTDTDGLDYFVLDRADGSWELVSTGEGWRDNVQTGPVASISDDGRRVAFVSDAHRATNRRDYYDVYVRDRATDRTELVSVSRSGRFAGGRVPQISGDGRVVAFDSANANLVRRDRNGRRDVFVRRLGADRTELVSVGPRGRQADRGSDIPKISADGRWVFFGSEAGNLVTDDTNRDPDVFRHDRRKDRTVRVSLTEKGRQVADGGILRTVSRSGRYVAFNTTTHLGGPRKGARSSDVYVRDVRRGTTRYLVDVAAYSPWTVTDTKYAAFTSFHEYSAADTNSSPDVYVAKFR
jgi:Tol biopolymer transport system component